MSTRPEWSVVRDGDSLAMLMSPDGRIFRIQQLGAGKADSWGNAEDNDRLMVELALAINQRNDRGLIIGQARQCGKTAMVLRKSQVTE